MDLDVRRLRLLREVALRGTIAAAAAAIGYTPSAVSQQLSVLERETGVPLLERAGRRLELTAAGRALVQRAGDVLAALEAATVAVEATRTTVTGSVRLTSFPSVSASLVVPALAGLEAEYPGLEITV